MKIDDFMRRWALHYANPDFLKIPMGESNRILLVKFVYNEYDIKAGGYGEYDTSVKSIKQAEGYLYKEIKNKDTGVISYKVFNNYIRTSSGYYLKNQYWTFHYGVNQLDKTDAFGITEPGTYYFLSNYTYTKTTNSSAENVTVITPAKLYKIIITKEFFQQHSVSINHIISDDKYYKISLYKYCNIWYGNQCLPNIQEPITKKLTEFHEWYDVSILKNGVSSTYIPKLRELVCCDFGSGGSGNHRYEVNGHNISPMDSLEAQDPNYTEQSNNISLNFSTFVIKYKSSITSTSWSHLKPNDLDYAVAPLVHHFFISESDTVSPYQRHEQYYKLSSNDSIDTQEIKTLYAHDHKRYGVFFGSTQDNVEANFQGYIKEGLYFDDNIQSIPPQSIDAAFSGWGPEAAIVRSSHKVPAASYNAYYNWFGPLYETVIGYDKYWWPTASSSSRPTNPNNEYQGETQLFKNTSTNTYTSASSSIYGAASVTSYPGVSALYDELDTSSVSGARVRYMTAFPAGAGLTNGGDSISHYSLPCTRYNFYMYTTETRDMRYSSSSWYQSSGDYIAIFQTSAYNRDVIASLNPRYTVFTSADVNDYTTWTVENTFASVYDEWGGETIAPPAGYNATLDDYVLQVYPLLSPELKEHIGFGYQDFTIVALTATLQQYGYEDELDKMLCEIAPPKELL